ncbi:hypothetical protein ACH518_01520 [Methylomonas sp. HW2-6]|uniref:hypothetical protein n=1 Tax=Methylomonas sp. HW2-6 TaxID=3376687 RepID=UPI004041258B
MKNKIIVELKFKSEPHSSELGKIKNDMRELLNKLEPFSKQELKSGVGSFWISWEVVLLSSTAWVTSQVLSWTFKKYLDRHHGPSLDRGMSNINDKINALRNPDNESKEKNQNVITKKDDISQIDNFNKIDLDLDKLLSFIDTPNFKGLTIKEQTDNGVNYTGLVARFTKSDDGKWDATFTKVDNREDFHKL